jgi:uncharacterized protein YjlB
MGMSEANHLILKSPNIPNLIKCRISKSKRKVKDTTTEKIPHHILGHGWFNFVRQAKLQVGHYLTFKYHLSPPAVHVEIVEKRNNA